MQYLKLTSSSTKLSSVADPKILRHCARSSKGITPAQRQSDCVLRTDGAIVEYYNESWAVLEVGTAAIFIPDTE